MDVRQSLVTAKPTAQLHAPSLNDHCTSLYSAIKSGLESSLSQVREFIGPTVAFAMGREFRREFCLRNVRAGIVMEYIKFVLDSCMVSHSRPNQPTNILRLFLFHTVTHTLLFSLAEVRRAGGGARVLLSPGPRAHAVSARARHGTLHHQLSCECHDCCAQLQHCTTPSNTTQHFVTLHNIFQYYTTLCGTTLHFAILYRFTHNLPSGELW